jgi:hypothetical protein
VPVTFQSVFAGPKNEYAIAYDDDGMNSGWQVMGTWAVPGTPTGPDFAVTAVQDTFYAPLGASTPSYALKVTPLNGFTGSVVFSGSAFNGCPTLSIVPFLVSGAPWTTTVSMSCYETQPGMTWWTTLYADGGGKSHQIYLFLSVANNTPSQYLLSTAVSPPGAGTTTLNPLGTGGWYNAGTQVAVTATPIAGYQFSGFTGADSSSGLVGYVTMNANRSVTANFTAVGAQYTLATAVSPAGAGTISPASSSYASGTQVQVMVTPAAGYTFAGFSGSLAGTALPQSLIMNGNKTVTAMFTATPAGQYSLTTRVNVAGRGTVTPGAGSYSSGSQVPVTATAAPGYTFTGFSGDLNGAVNPQTVTINAAKSVTANFAAAAEPDFTLDLPTSVQVEAGFQNSFRLRIAPQNGFSSPVIWTLTQAVSGVTTTWAAHSQIPTAATATGTLYAVASAVPGTYSLSVQADGGGKSHSANITVQVVQPYRRQSETNMAFVDFLKYNDTSFVDSTLPVLGQTCGYGGGIRACHQRIMNSYRAQQISGVRVMFSLSDAIRFDTGSIRNEWLAGLRAFLEDLYNNGSSPLRVTLTPSWDWPHFDAAQYGYPQGGHLVSTPTARAGCTDGGFYPAGTELLFNRVGPFAQVRRCDGTGCTGWTTDGTADWQLKVAAYTCAMGNPTPNFIGWNGVYDLIDKILEAVRDNAVTVQEFDVTNEIQLSGIAVRARLIVDNTNGNEDVLGTVGSGRRSLRQSMFNSGFDPGRVTYSVIGGNPQQSLGECPASNPSYFGDSGRISELSLLTAIIGTGGPVGVGWNYDVEFDNQHPRFPGSGLACGVSAPGPSLAYTHSQPTIIDVHSGPCVNVPHWEQGSGECDPRQWGNVAGEATAMGNALAAFQNSFSPGGWRGYVPDLASALVMLGETHGRVKSGDLALQQSICRVNNQTPGFTACSMQFAQKPPDLDRRPWDPLLEKACWKVSAGDDTYTGFSSSILGNRTRPNGLPASIVFRPWEYLQQWDEPQANACTTINTNPPYIPVP